MFDYSYDVGYVGWIILLIILIEIILWLRSRKPAGFPPGPTPLPIIGNFHNLGNKDFIQAIRDLRNQYGDIFTLSLGKFWVIVVNGRDNLHELFVKRGEVTSDRPPLFVMNLTKCKGIISASGSGWKHQRTFALSKLRDFGFGKRSFESGIQEEISAFLALLETYNAEPFDISGKIQTSMSNNIMAITVGRRFEYDDENFKYFVDLLEKNIKDDAFVGLVNFAPFLANIPGDNFGGQRITKDAKEIMDFVRKQIEEHKLSLDENNIRDFIDVYLIEMMKNPNSDIFTEEQLVYVIFNLFAAGTETSSTTIKWTIIYLLQNMDIQNKMWKEIDEVVGSGRLLCMADKPKLPYCDAVVQESLRVGNIVPFSLPHMATEDIYFKGYKIPKDSVIFPSLDSVVHDESLFPDSGTFKPERFLDEDGKVIGQENVWTFSLGRRVCLGESLARMELFLYLTALVQRFEFLPAEGEDPPPIEGQLGITYGPKTFKFRATPRK